ncbi:uncharacterized protein LOC133134650 [Conger conger]|uniref:uncharacterized protein LOC133134650 n=1 Tax=Conger conger TaxID=82655 RepID=UPI002A5AB7A0|nr:uncharacterized protein LOC133134650 [Conger conger]
MNSPVAYFIFYILVLQLISAANGSTANLVPESQQNGPRETSSPSTGTDPDSVHSTPSHKSSSTVGQEILSNSTHDGSIFTAFSRQDSSNATEDDANSMPTETSPLNTETQKSAATEPGDTTQEVSTEKAPKIQTIAAVKPDLVPGSTAAPQEGDSAGIVTLLVILFSIIILMCVIYFLHKKSKSYSFDLHHKIGEEASIPLNTVDQDGSFQPTLPKEDSPATVHRAAEENTANNITVGSSPNGSTSENTAPTLDIAADDANPEKPPSEDSFGSQVPLSPIEGPGTFTLDLNDMDIDLNRSTHTSVESLGEQQNGNNNNMATGDTAGEDSAQADLNKDYTEIGIDETA